MWCNLDLIHCIKNTLSVEFQQYSKGRIRTDFHSLSRVYTIKVFLVKVRQRKLGQSFLGQGQLFTLSKFLEQLVQEIDGKCIEIY